MADGFGVKCTKYTLFAFNLIFFMCGLAVLGVGIWFMVDKSSFVTLTARAPDIYGDLGRYSSADTVLQQTAYLLVAAGILSIVVAFIGCWGAIKEWRPLLIAYAVLLLMILGLEIAAGIYAAVFRSTSGDYIATTMATTLIRQYQNRGLVMYNKTEAVVNREANFWTKAWDQMMVQLECCGVRNGFDFISPGPMGVLEQYRDTDAPLACCQFKNRNNFYITLVSPGECDVARTKGWTNWERGCLPRLINWLDENLRILVGVGIGIGLVHIFGIIFAFCLCMAIQTRKDP
ncbi:hypothetical protein RvY_15830-1 [Ramazzottius varieornatus]|uniref:Tetraspanin n=1 Tax=Ramazzottius varieornatus TaxID=947166 RepID=A0A1D1W452_RAMVA|nr:hypothetical protein RvY_15830-1 [Ramazzottius varieornatus]